MEFLRGGCPAHACHSQLFPRLAEWRSDLPAGLDEKIADLGRKPSPSSSMTLSRLLTNNRIWKQRTVDIGIISAGGRAGLGLQRVRHCGPAACLGICASSQPYEMYEQVWSSTSRSGATATATTATSCGSAEMRREREDHPRNAWRGCTPGPGEDPGPQVHGAAPRVEMKKLDGGADPSLQALHRGLPRASPAPLTRPRSRAPRASSAFISSPTAPTVRIAARSAPRGSPILQAMEKHMSKRHMLADAVAIIGSHRRRVRRDR